MSIRRWRRAAALLPLFTLFSSLLPLQPTTVLADHTATPVSVNLVGSLQSEATAGACGDWDPKCAGSAFAAPTNNVYVFDSASIPGGAYEYKIALGDWAENYGGNFKHDGPNIALSLSAAQTVRFFYDHKTHFIADSARNTIYTVPGSFGSAIGCGNWAPECAGSLMSDVDGDGTYTFSTDKLAAGTYEFKIATNQSWSNPNYGANGGSSNIGFTVPAGGGIVTFSFNSATNTPSVGVKGNASSPDNNVEWNGLRHDSRDLLYRTPGGAVPVGTPVTIRFRTLHNDVTAVTLRLYDLNRNGQQLIPMTIAASDIACYEADLAERSCDLWSATINPRAANNFWYRFIVTDGTDTDYYGDNTAALDGGLGSPSDDAVDQSYALMFHEPAFRAPAWAKSAVIYQIFPDRFRNGRDDNNPKTGDLRYDDPVLKLPWSTLPEGYCRNYSDAATQCPWRFDQTPPDYSPTKEGPRGRDYMGGDLKGVDQQLEYLQSLGVTAIYFNPIFDAGSNHSYDTQNYYKIDPYFGTQKDWDNLVKHANRLGIRIILDGVFNHLSSDSPFFDRYGHYAEVGACESASSPYRSWFRFRPPTGNEPAVCAPSTPRGNDTYYDGWFGFDSIPVLDKSNPAVQAYFLSQPNNVTQYWLEQGAAAWRLDVMGDASFPNGYWEQFRRATKQTKSDALIIGELWQKDSTLLRYLRGDRADTTMNYRLRDAVLSLLAPGGFDSKGFGDSGRVIKPSEFAARLQSIREDYPDAAYYSLMNLLDSHDTERLLWTLTPGEETSAAKEQNAANVANGKERVRLASLIQFTVPGAPTVYYGDEVGLTGDDDPDDRRTYPWEDLGENPDKAMFQHYQALAKLRRDYPALVDGDLRVLLADDAAGTVAYGRRTASQAALVVLNRSSQPRTVTIPVADYTPNDTVFSTVYGGAAAASTVTVAGGNVSVTLSAMSGLVLATANNVDLTPPAAPTALKVTEEASQQLTLAWNRVAGAAAYNVYRSPVSGGGWIKVNAAPLTGTSFTDTGLRNARAYYYIVKALDSAGNESAASHETSGLPHHKIGWANLQWPPTLTHAISTTNRTGKVYGQVWIDGVTKMPGATEGLVAQLGYGPDGSDPAGNNNWQWVAAAFNIDTGNNDEFVAGLLPEALGTFDYAYRYSTTGGRDWVYADLDAIANGYSAAGAGSLTVNSSGDTSAPAVPTGLRVVTASPAGVELAWNADTGDSSLYGYEVRRKAAAEQEFRTIAWVTADTKYTDTTVAGGAAYAYVVRAVDTSFNRSGASAAVTATAELRTVTLVFNVTVPDSTDETGKSVYIAGFLDRLEGGLPQWNPGGVVLKRKDATTWTITLTGKESTQIEYKYALGAWDFVEKDAACGEVANRQLTLSYGADGTQTIDDTVLNWRNVAPCGN